MKETGVGHARLSHFKKPTGHKSKTERSAKFTASLHSFFLYTLQEFTKQLEYIAQTLTSSQKKLNINLESEKIESQNPDTLIAE